MRLIDADALIMAFCNGLCGSDPKQCGVMDANRHEGCVLRKYTENAPAVDAAPVVRCKDCRHRKLDGPSTCKSIVNEFYCDEKLGWRYQYEGEPDILDWFCADGELADAPTCGPDYCEIGGGDDK